MGGPAWGGEKGTHCGNAHSPPLCYVSAAGVTALSGGGWPLLGVDYSLKCCLGPMLLCSAEIPFCSNEISVRMLEGGSLLIRLVVIKLPNHRSPFLGKMKTPVQLEEGKPAQWHTG